MTLSLNQYSLPFTLMTNRFTRLIKDAYQLPRHKRDMTEQQRNLYQATKHAYTKGTPAQRANLRTNARAMVSASTI